MDKEQLMEAIQELASNYKAEFFNIYKLSQDELAFLFQVLSKTLVQDEVIRLGIDKGKRAGLVDKAVNNLKGKGYEVYTTY